MFVEQLNTYFVGFCFKYNLDKVFAQYNTGKRFLMRIEHSRQNKSPEFTMIELEKVLKSLKNAKSKDFNGYINELFKEGVAGTDLKTSLLMMFNEMKKEIV